MALHKDLTGQDLHYARIRSGNGTPIGFVTPSIEGEVYFDKASKTLYISNGTTVNSWIEDKTGALASLTTVKKNNIVEALNELNANKSDISHTHNTDTLTEGSSNVFFTNERAQDAVGAILTDTSSIDFTYDDDNNNIKADVRVDGKSIVIDTSNNFIKVKDNLYANKIHSHHASDIEEDLNHRFVTDEEKLTWNNKQDSLGYTPLNKSGDKLDGPLTLHNDPTNPMHAASKAYVDASKQKSGAKESVRLATTSNIPLSASSPPSFPYIDGIQSNAGDRILVKDQDDGTENGIYILNDDGSLTRSYDANSSEKVTSGLTVFVEEGNTFSSCGFVLATPNPIELGITDLKFTQFTGTGQIITGTGLVKIDNTLFLEDTEVSEGTYEIPTITVDRQGRITSAKSNSLPLAAPDSNGLMSSQDYNLVHDKLKLRTMVFVLPVIKKLGAQKLLSSPPFDGTIKQIRAICSSPCISTQTEIYIEKMSQQNFGQQLSWERISTSPLSFGVNQYNADVPPLSSSVVNNGDVYRLYVETYDPSIEGLMISIDVEL